MFPFYSFLQAALQFVRELIRPAIQVSKRMHRQAAVLTSGCMVIAVVAFTAAGFGAGGKNALTAFAEGRYQEGSDALEETDAEDLDLITEAKIQAEFAALKQESSLIGQNLVKNTEKKIEESERAKAELEAKQEKIQEEKEAEARRIAEEEAKRKAEEERRAARRISCSQSDYQVLLKIVQAEAGICDAKGRILVANVIMNRVRDKQFPNTVTEVVYQSGQFSPVSDGRINQVEVTDLTVECVNRALAGEDYSQGALYFMNRGRSQTRAIGFFDSKLTYLFTHDGHEFFK